MCNEKRAWRSVTAGLTLAMASVAAQAITVEVFANENSVSGGVGAFALNLAAGETFAVSVSPDDLWNAGAVPRWSNANGLVSNLEATASTDPQALAYPGVTIGGTIGGNFGSVFLQGLSAPYGALVGRIGSGDYFFVGTSYSGVASTDGELNLYYWDANRSDNTGSVVVTVQTAAVPEAGTLLMSLAGLSVIGLLTAGRRAGVRQG
jgi:hypothetical protein